MAASVAEAFKSGSAWVSSIRVRIPFLLGLKLLLVPTFLSQDPQTNIFYLNLRIDFPYEGKKSSSDKSSLYFLTALVTLPPSSTQQQQQQQLRQQQQQQRRQQQLQQPHQT